jgi:hypothetical protein
MSDYDVVSRAPSLPPHPDDPYGVISHVPTPPPAPPPGAAKQAAASSLQGPQNPLADLVQKILEFPQAIADAGANRLAEGSHPGDVTNPEAKNPANWTQNEPSSPLAATALHIAPAALAMAGIPGQAGAAVKAGRAATEALEGPFGMRTGESNPIARNVAGSSAQPAVAARNQAIADPRLGAQAGVTPGTKLAPKSLEDARDAPNSVYQRAGENIPTGNLSPTAEQMVQGVGADDMIVHSPDTQATIDAQKARLLSGPMTGPEVVNAQKALRFNGFKNIGSEDPEQLALGHAQLKMSDALHQHMLDTLQENAPVSADQLNSARVALAQNHTVESVLGPNGNVNLTKLAKIHNDNPGMLTGPMRDIAQFASDHPEVTRLPSDAERFNPSGVGKDVAGVDIKNPQTWLQPFFGAAARNALTRGAEAPPGPVTGLGGEFAPLAPRQPAPLDLQPSPGQAFTPHQPQAATGNPQRSFFGTGADHFTASPPTGAAPAAAGSPGQLSLADLLSHGVEQSPSEGLSFGPMGAPEQTGIPFARNAAHEAGGLELAPGHTYGGQPANNSDLGNVMSQVVPKDIMTRTTPAHFVENNDSIGGAASLEAQRRLKLNLEMVDPDGHGMPIIKDVTQADVEPLSGHVIVDRDTGKITKSGDMKPSLARNLLARWKARQQEPQGGPALGSEF